MTKEYWFLIHWLKDIGTVRDSELDIKDRHCFEWFRHEGWARLDQGWWELTERGHDILTPCPFFDPYR